MPARQRNFERSPCPIANTLDLLGDKWTLLVVRDLVLFGKHRFVDFAASGESIPTNLLADRLERLQRARCVTRRRYQTNPPRYAYHLTHKGRDLLPVLRAMVEWANRHIPGTPAPPAWLREKLAG